MATATKWEPREVVVRHGIFWYFKKEMQVLPDKDTNRLKEQEVLIQRTANQNDVITVELEADYQRGVDHHAFWTEDELKSTQPQTPAQLIAGAPGEGEGDEPQDPMTVPIGELDSGELVEWIQGSGQFDEYDSPTGDEVVEKVGNDAELAERVLTAEKSARDKPRVVVERELNKVIEAATAS